MGSVAATVAPNLASSASKITLICPSTGCTVLSTTPLLPLLPPGLSSTTDSSPSAGQTCGPNLSLLPERKLNTNYDMADGLAARGPSHLWTDGNLGSTNLLTDLKSSSGLYFPTSPPNLVTSSSSSSVSSSTSPQSVSSLVSASPPTASTSMVLPANFDAQRRAVKKGASVN